MKNAHHPADQKQVFDRACGLREMSNELFFRVFFITLNVFFAKGLDTNYLDSQGNNGLYDALEAANKIQHHSKPHGKVSQICPVNLIRKGQIIKTNDSIRAGARFLDTPSVGTVKECHEICCNLLGCNTAIVKVINSSKVSCYLFDCGIVPKCSFDAHKDYKVIELNYQTKNVDSASNQSDELVLKNVSHVVKKPGIICQPGYHAVGNDCRENCSNEFYFECSNIDRPAFKQCIATYDKCDGYQQCDDNSDEINCPLNEDVKAEVNDTISLTITRRPSKMSILTHVPNMKDLVKAGSIQGEMKTYIEFPNPLPYYPALNRSILQGNLKNDSQLLDIQSPLHFDENHQYWKSIQNDNRAVDFGDIFNGHDLREPHPDDNPIAKSHFELSNNGIRENNASVHDFTYGGVTHGYDGGGLSKIIDIDKTDGDHLAATSDVVNPARNLKSNQYNAEAYNRHLKVDEFSVVPHKHQGIVWKGSLHQDSLLDDVKHRSQISSNSKVESTRKNLLSWNPHFYDGMNHVFENVNDGGIIDGNKDKTMYVKQHMLEDSNYAKELADYGNKIKVSTEPKSLSLNIDDRLRKSSLDDVDRQNDNNVRKHDLFDFDRSGYNLLGNAYYDAARLQNHVDPNSRSRNLVNYYKKFAIPNKILEDGYHSKEVDSFSNYLAPSNSRLDYYIEYETDPKQLYDYEYKLHNLDPITHQNSVLRRIASNYFSPNVELNRVRSGYFSGVSSKEDSNKVLSLHTNTQYGERATARSTSQIPRVRSTTLTEHNSSPIQIITLPVTSTSLSTSAPSLMKSFSFKFIELSKFSKHRVEDFKGGAVLVLSLGIGLVIVSLAVFICQLQKFRKYGRNRKAKNMDGDSDYLINGLYL